MILRYPAIALTPIFSYWTFGDPDVIEAAAAGSTIRNPDIKLKVSFRLTWGNAILTTFGNLGLFLVHIFTRDLSTNWFNENVLLHSISVLFTVLSWITLIILQNLPRCQKVCFSYCQNDQVFQKTALDPNFPEKMIDLSKPVTQDMEMVANIKPTNEDTFFSSKVSCIGSYFMNGIGRCVHPILLIFCRFLKYQIPR